MSAPYFWWIAGLLLIAAEVLAPGFFLLWIGLAALALGMIVWFVPGLALLWQAVLFGLLAFASCLAYWRFVRPNLHGPHSPHRHLNRRGEQLIGKHYVLDTPIENGRGRARVGDSQWLVEGPDLPAGSRIEVVAVDGAMLKVRAAE